MAIFMVKVRSGSRAGGQSAAAKVRYITRQGKYATKGEEDLEITVTGNMPAWADGDALRYFQAADEHERANGRLFLSVIVALPDELEKKERHALARDFAARLSGGKLPYVMAVHSGRPQIDRPMNPHLHIVLSERALDGYDRTEATWFKRANKAHPEKGGAAKDRSVKGRDWIDGLRGRWEDCANEHLERDGVDWIRLDKRSRAERLLTAGPGEAARMEWEPPQVPRGPAADAMERRGVTSPNCEADRRQKAGLERLAQQHSEIEAERIRVRRERDQLVRKELAERRAELVALRKHRAETRRLGPPRLVERPRSRCPGVRPKEMVRQLESRLDRRRQKVDRLRAASKPRRSDRPRARLTRMEAVTELRMRAAGRYLADRHPGR